VQDVLESKLEKQKRRKGVIGPLIGTINIVFIDDLNMPSKEEFGAQPPVELIRQWFSQGGWYDLKSLEFNSIVDILFSAAMSPGRPLLSSRLIRHFNLVYLNETDALSLQSIVTKILEWGYFSYVDKVQQQVQNLARLSILIHTYAQSQFLPLPRKPHYLFNLRDLMKAVQGLLAVPSSQYEASSDVKAQLLRLWTNECRCIYMDRLSDAQD